MGVAVQDALAASLLVKSGTQLVLDSSAARIPEQTWSWMDSVGQWILKIGGACRERLMSLGCVGLGGLLHSWEVRVKVNVFQKSSL